MSLAVGIDIGTSGVRLVALDPQHQIYGKGECLMSEIGENHRCPHLWWQAVQRAWERLLKTAIEPSAIQSIAVDGTSGTMLAIDEEGNPLCDALMYHDAIDDEDIMSAIAHFAPRESAVHSQTSGLAKALFFLKKFKNHHGQPRLKKVLHQADWIAGKFMDKYCWSDANNALKTGYSPEKECWSHWIEKIQIEGSDLFSMQLLPEVVRPSVPLRNVSRQIADSFQLNQEVMMVAGTTDGCASFLATGANQIGEAVTALGSTLVLKQLVPTPIFNPDFGIYSHRIGEMWLAGGASNTGGQVLQKFFDTPTIQKLSQSLNPQESTGLNYYPLCKAGERFPINNPQLSPRLEPRPASHAKFLQAMLEGIAQIEQLGYERLQELGAPALKSVRTVGGGSANEAWTLIRQKMLNVPFENAFSEDAAVGTAFLALKAI